MGEAHLRVDRVFDAVFAAAESVGGVLFSAILNRAASASEWRVVATSRAEMCPIGKPVTGDFLTVDEADSTQDPRTVEGSGVEALFPCMAGADCRQLVACNMPAYSQAEEGILAVGRSECRPLDEEDENFLRALAMQAQLAIHNALLYRRRDQDFQRLKAFNQMQDAFFSAAADELKTPLTALREGAELLSDEIVGKLTPEQRAGLDSLLRGRGRVLTPQGETGQCFSGPGAMAHAWRLSATKRKSFACLPLARIVRAWSEPSSSGQAPSEP